MMPALMLARPGEQGKRLEQEKPAVEGPVALQVRGSYSTVRRRNAVPARRSNSLPLPQGIERNAAECCANRIGKR
jgi:hypothetical protein